MSYNVYYAKLGASSPTEGVARTISDYRPSVASIQEMWGEKPAILSQIRSKTGLDYAFADGGGNSEKWWDGDILYRADQWRVLDNGVELFDGSRGLTWAAMRHRDSGEELLVYGIHPLCCSGGENHLNVMKFATDHMTSRQRYPDAPIISMGDFNAQEFDDSQVLLREGQRNAYGRNWTIPMRFTDTFRAARGMFADARTLGDIRVDYIYTENRGGTTFRTTGADIRRDAPGGSDHWPITAEVTLKSSSSQ